MEQIFAINFAQLTVRYRGVMEGQQVKTLIVYFLLIDLKFKKSHHQLTLQRPVSYI